MSRPLLAGIVTATLLAGAQPAVTEIYSSNRGSDPYRIVVHANGASGNAAPLRAITGDDTNLSRPKQIFADVLHGELYVANDSDYRITVYPLGASGDQPPLRTLEGSLTLLDDPGGVAVDLVHDELIVGNFGHGSDGSITVYPRTANGNVAPLRRIAGGATNLIWVTTLAFDQQAGEIVVACQGFSPAPAGIRVFSRTANGNAAPLRLIAGAATKIDTPYGIALDPVHHEILLTDRAGAVSAFAKTANGNVAPLRRIAGITSQLDETIGVSLLGASEIVVSNQGESGGNFSDDSLLVFPRTANGNFAPARKINGPATSVGGPNGVAVVSPRLALRGGRFGVQAVFRTQSGNIGDGMPIPLTTDTGWFWFFSATNVEIMVKVLNGCDINHRFWVFAGGLTDVNVDLVVTDYATGAVRTYTNPQKTAFQPIQDTDAFATCDGASSPSAPVRVDRAALPDRAAAGTIATPSEPATVSGASVIGNALYLNNDRFEVRTEWEDRHGGSGVGHPFVITGDTGYFWFFQPENIEVVVKVLNACAGPSHRYWVFAGGLTDVRVRLTVLDKVQGTATKTYINPQQTAFQPITDTSAFATCP